VKGGGAAWRKVVGKGERGGSVMGTASATASPRWGAVWPEGSCLVAGGSGR